MRLSRPRDARFGCLFALVVCANAALAATLELSVLGETLYFPIPNGYCALDTRFRSDHAALDFLNEVQSGRNEILAGFADCAQISSFRNGTRDAFDDYGVYFTMLPKKKIPGISRQEFVKAVPRPISSFNWDSVNTDILGALKKEGADVSDLMTEGGIIYQDDDALYLGFTIAAGTEAEAGVGGITLLKAIPISTNIYTPLKGADSFRVLLQRSRRLIRDLESVN